MMSHSSHLSQFETQGYAILPAKDVERLRRLKDFVQLRIADYLGTQDPASIDLDSIHKYVTDPASINDLRLKLIQDCDMGELWFSREIYSAFRDFINSNIGPDVYAQRHTNLVIQEPQSQFYAELHNDTPVSSEHEIVAWIPLTDCYPGKTLYIVDLECSLNLAERYMSGEYGDWESFRKTARQYAHEVTVPYGSCLMFWSGLWHGSDVNRTEETRWSLNIRYKSIFSPSGIRDPRQYFKVLNTSPITRFAIRYVHPS